MHCCRCNYPAGFKGVNLNFKHLQQESNILYTLTQKEYQLSNKIRYNREGTGNILMQNANVWWQYFHLSKILNAGLLLVLEYFDSVISVQLISGTSTFSPLESLTPHSLTLVQPFAPLSAVGPLHLLLKTEVFQLVFTHSGAAPTMQLYLAQVPPKVLEQYKLDCV